MGTWLFPRGAEPVYSPEGGAEGDQPRAVGLSNEGLTWQRREVRRWGSYHYVLSGNIELVSGIQFVPVIDVTGDELSAAYSRVWTNKPLVWIAEPDEGPFGVLDGQGHLQRARERQLAVEVVPAEPGRTHAAQMQQLEENAHTERLRELLLTPTLTPPVLREYREALGLSQATLASRLGVAPNTVSRWELGRMAIDRPEWVKAQLDRIAAGPGEEDEEED